LTTFNLTYLLEYPDQMTSVQTTELEKILHEFPYLQPARAIYLKGLYSQNSYRYNSELKISAAYTTNRTILFNFITSPLFKSIKKDSNSMKIDGIDIEQIEVKKNTSFLNNIESKSIENSILKSIVQADTNLKQSIIKWEPSTNMLDPEKETNSITNIADLIKQEPEKLIEFNPSESHSFSQWLQLTKMKPIDRSNEELINKIETDKKSNKFELIDKFIETNPKIGAAKIINAPINIEKSSQENSHLMTETLATIYLQQKKYQKAIQAYEILILKYPEKSSLFAERIVEIKKIQNNNN